jgi:hypothetical protein
MRVGRPSMLHVWRWCVARCLKERNKAEANRVRKNLRDPLEPEEHAAVEGDRAKLNDLSKSILGCVIAFADRLEEADVADNNDDYYKILAEAGSLRPYCEALMHIREALDPGGCALYSRLHHSVGRRRRLHGPMEGIYKRVAADASKRFRLPVKATSVKREWKHHSRLINRAIRDCSNGKT